MDEEVIQKDNSKVFCCRWAPSLGALEGGTEDCWGTKNYVYKEDKYKPTVFWGLYDLRDYFALLMHRGKKWVLWAGSDLRNLKAGFVFNDGKLRWLSKILRGNWFVVPLLFTAEHWVENVWERDILRSFGIESNICPSFMGDKNAYPVTYKWKERPDVYLSASEGRQKEYGWELVEKIAPLLPKIRFHLYGAKWNTKHENVIAHGRVPKEQMNEEIKNMQCGLRLNETDGFSEVTAKSVLWGQYPITKIPNKLIPHFENESQLLSYLRSLTITYDPNHVARRYYLSHLNNYPWVV